MSEHAPTDDEVFIVGLIVGTLQTSVDMVGPVIRHGRPTNELMIHLDGHNLRVRVTEEP